MPESDNPESQENSRITLNDLADLRERPVLYVNHLFDADCVGEVREISEKLESTEKLAVLLESPGGDIECAYRMILALRDRDKVHDIEVLVPRWAKSAATFFCLAADSIHMGRYGELGPLDPQMLNRTGSARVLSALETFKALEHLLNYSLESLDGIIQLLLERSHMDIPHAIGQAHPLFSAVVSQLYAQVDPHELGESGRYLSISEEYAVRVMKRWSYAEFSDQARRRIAQKLVWEYPTHGFVIDLDEAQEIGLKAERLDEASDMMCWGILSTLEESTGIGWPSATGASTNSGTEADGILESADSVDPTRTEIAEPGQDENRAPV